MIDWQKLFSDLAPYVLPALMVAILEYSRRKAETRKVNSESEKTDAEASRTMVEAAQGLVGTGGVLVTQIREQYKTLDADYRKAVATLEETNNRYMMAMEEISSLSMRLSSLRTEMEKLSNTILDKDIQIKHLRRCVQWSLRHLRNLWRIGGTRLFMEGIDLPSVKEEEAWISRADTLNGEPIPPEELENKNA